MTTHTKSFYRPPLSELICPHLLTHIARVTAVRWLDAEAMQVVAQTQQDAYMNPQGIEYPPNMPSLQVLAKAAAERYLSSGDNYTKAQSTLRRVPHQPSQAVSLLVHRYFDAVDRQAEAELTTAIAKELSARGIRTQGHVGGLWARMVLNINPFIKEYEAFCYLTERRLLNQAIKGESNKIALRLAECMEHAAHRGEEETA